MVLWYPFDFSPGKWQTIKSASFTIMNISNSFFQAEGVGAISEREGQCDPIRCDPWGNPLHRLSAQPAGEEDEWGRRERGGKEITRKPEESTPSLVSSLISLSFISLLCDISQIYLPFKLCESILFLQLKYFPIDYCDDICSQHKWAKTMRDLSDSITLLENIRSRSNLPHLRGQFPFHANMSLCKLCKILCQKWTVHFSQEFLFGGA